MRPRMSARSRAAVGGAVRRGRRRRRSAASRPTRVRSGPAALFVALRGRAARRARFVAEALERRSGCRRWCASGLAVEAPAVHVRSTGEALLRPRGGRAARVRAARSWRSRARTGRPRPRTWPAPSSATRLRTHASPESFNNEVGVPLDAARRARRTPRSIVAEMGARHVGDVRRAVRGRPARHRGGRDERRASRTWRCSDRGRRSSRPRPSRSTRSARRRHRDPRRPTTRSSPGTAARTRAPGGDLRHGRRTRTSAPRRSRSIATGGRRSSCDRGDERANVRLAVPGEHMVLERARRRRGRRWSSACRSRRRRPRSPRHACRTVADGDVRARRRGSAS